MAQDCHTSTHIYQTCYWTIMGPRGRLTFYRGRGGGGKKTFKKKKKKKEKKKKRRKKRKKKREGEGGREGRKTRGVAGP